MSRIWQRQRIFRCAVFALAFCLMIFTVPAAECMAAGTTTVTEETTTAGGIDWGHGVTTDVILEWAVTIAGCICAIFVLCSVAVMSVLEKKKK